MTKVLGALACAAALWAAAVPAAARRARERPARGRRARHGRPAVSPQPGRQRPAHAVDRAGRRRAVAARLVARRQPDRVLGGRPDRRCTTWRVAPRGPDHDGTRTDAAWTGDRIGFRRGLALMSVAADGTDLRVGSAAGARHGCGSAWPRTGSGWRTWPARRSMWSRARRPRRRCSASGVRGAPAWSADSARIAFSHRATAGRSSRSPRPSRPPRRSARPAAVDTRAGLGAGRQPGRLHARAAHGALVCGSAGPHGDRRRAGRPRLAAVHARRDRLTACRSPRPPARRRPAPRRNPARPSTFRAPVCTDPAGRALTVRVVEGPAHGALNGARYTPAAGFSGQDAVAYQASNGVLDSNVVRQADLRRPARPRLRARAPTPPRAPFLNARGAPRLDRRGRTEAAGGAATADCRVSLRLTARAARRFKSKTLKRSLTAGQRGDPEVQACAAAAPAASDRLDRGHGARRAGHTRAVKLPVTLPR